MDSPIVLMKTADLDCIIRLGSSAQVTYFYNSVEILISSINIIWLVPQVQIIGLVLMGTPLITLLFVIIMLPLIIQVHLLPEPNW